MMLDPKTHQTPIRQGTSLAAALASALLMASAASAQTSCVSTQDSCDGTHSSLFAIAHDHNDPNTLLLRVNLPEQPTGTSWGDGVNGFFYQFQTTSTGDWNAIVPFNGIGNNANGVPTLRPFSFIVPMAKENTTLSVRACATNYTSTTPGVTECTKTLWTDSFASLPSPSIGSDRSAPASLPTGFDLEFVSESVLARNNGVYGAIVSLKPISENVQVSLTQAQIDWLYDHIVFFDQQYNVHDNNLFPGEGAVTKPFGVLKLEEAGYPVTPGGSEYLVKYTNSDTAVKPTEPGSEAFLHFWVYSTDTTISQPIQLGAGWLYDASADCLGALNGDAVSNSSNCTVEPTLVGDEPPYVEVNLLSGGDVRFTTQPDADAGLKTVRNVTLGVSDEHSMCTHAANPLAAYSENGVNLPNYLVGTTLANTSWQSASPPPAALYYVLPSGFGNCGSANAPFCEQTDSYSAYIPHYLDTAGNGGVLNGGGTANRLVGSVNIADQYALSAFSGSDSPTGNNLISFDNCGYGHEFSDSSLSSRIKELPTPPFTLKSYAYDVASAGNQAMNLVKECCASFYQEVPGSCSGTEEDPTGCSYMPPEQIGQGFGMFLPQQQQAGSVVAERYQTLFKTEAMAAYSAASGELISRFILDDLKSAQIQQCPGGEASLTLTAGAADSDPSTLHLYDTASAGTTKCAGAPVCPYGTKEQVYAAGGKSYRSCVATTSDFLLNLDLWAGRGDVSGAEGVIVTAWGAYGMSGKQGNPCHDGPSGYTGGHAGHPGFAQTVLKPTELPSSLYAYIGGKPTADQYSHSGASSVLARIPLSSLDPKSWTNGEIVNEKHVLLIAGGGGGGGEGSFCGAVPAYQGGYGGNGGVASATAGSAVSTQGSNGKYKGNEETGGHGGNSSGTGNAGNSSSGPGVGGFSGSGEQWFHTGSLLPPSSWAAGKGAGDDGTGGGGYGGAGNGGKPHSWASGGGGGGSWATANTVTLSGVFPSSLPVPSEVGGAVALSYPASCEGDCMAGGAIIIDGTNYQECVSKEHEGVLLKSSKAYFKWFSNGNMEMWENGGQKLIWTAGQDNKGNELCFTTSGDLEIKDDNGHTIWTTNTNNGNYLTLNDCTMSIINSNGGVVWQIDYDASCE